MLLVKNGEENPSSWAEKTKRMLYRRLHIIEWLPKYTKVNFISDLIAGITVGLTMIPQSLAYARLADLPGQYGLYTAFIGSFTYIFFGTIKEVSIGPTSLMAIMVYSYTQDKPVDYIILLGFLSGCVEFAMGFLNLGFAVDFISAPVISGFTSATSIIIILTQVKGILGLKFKNQGIIDLIRQLFSNLSEIKKADAMLGLGCVIFLCAIKKITSRRFENRRIAKAMWFLSICRNALVVIISSYIGFYFEEHKGGAPFGLSGHIPSGLPKVSFPPFSTTVKNETVPFLHMMHDLGSGILLVPVVAVLANVAIAKSFAAGDVVDATQEMISLGLCNIFGSFVQAMPATGAFTRSAVAHASGVRTPLQGLYSGSIILLSLSFLTPYFYYIPRTTLSAILICAVVTLIDYEILPKLWRSSKFDLTLTITTFIVGVFYGIELGLLSGTIINMLCLLKPWTRPNIQVTMAKDKSAQEYIIIKPELGLLFPAVDYLTKRVLKLSLETDDFTPIVIDFRNVLKVDYSACQALNNLIEVQRKKSRQLIFQNISPDVFIMLKSTLKEENLSLCHSTESIFDNKTKVDCNKWTAAQVPLLESNNHRNLNLSDTEPPV